MKLRALTQDDANALLAFEIENRNWFEQHIDPRRESFYSFGGVTEHIKQLVVLKNKKQALPLVIISDNEHIAGRINFTHINQPLGTARHGYRIGEAFVNQGLAKKAVGAALNQIGQFNLEKVIAFASTHNIASQKVLLANGFKPVKHHPNYTQVQGISQDCIEFQLA